MYKPWPKCPKCANPLTLARQSINLQGEKEISPNRFECRPCEFSLEAVKPSPGTV